MDNINKQNKRRLNKLSLHIILLVLTLCSYLWSCSVIRADVLSWIGNAAFPIAVFLLTEGFKHTRSRGKYALRLFFFGLIAEVPFNRVSDPLEQNIMLTLLLCLAMLCLLEATWKLQNKAVKLCLSAAVIWLFYNLAFLLLVQFYGYAILMTALFYFTGIRKEEQNSPNVPQKLTQFFGMMIICCFLMSYPPLFSFELFGLEVDIGKHIFALLALPLIWMYNGELGRYNVVIKYAFYIFYPLQLMILHLI